MKRVSVIEFHSEHCIQCHACELACASWRALPDGVRLRKVRSYFTGTYPNAKLISLSVSCLHCLDAPCAQSCPVGAISRQKNGPVTVDNEKCIACRACEGVCPVSAPQFAPGLPMQKCDLCTWTDGPYCVATCPTGALQLQEMTSTEKATYDTKMINLIRHR